MSFRERFSFSGEDEAPARNHENSTLPGETSGWGGLCETQATPNRTKKKAELRRARVMKEAGGRPGKRLMDEGAPATNLTGSPTPSRRNLSLWFVLSFDRVICVLYAVMSPYRSGPALSLPWCRCVCSRYVFRVAVRTGVSSSWCERYCFARSCAW